MPPIEDTSVSNNICNKEKEVIYDRINNNKTIVFITFDMF